MTTIRERQTPEYRASRDDLARAEADLKDQRERVAELRRKLPLGVEIEEDYVFAEGPADLDRNDPSDFVESRLSELFSPGKDDLIVQHMMMAPDWERGCPMCSMWVDGMTGIAPHLADRLDFAVVARAPIARLRAWGKVRGWGTLRLLSSLESNFNADFGVELAEDRQLPAYSVLSRDSSGRIHHRYTTELSLVESHHRAMDLFSPVWNFFDLLPDGRGDWMPRHSYE